VRGLLERLDAATPEIRNALDANPLIPEDAETRRGRDAELAARTCDVTRADMQNAHRIIGEGPWIQSLKDALARGEVLPAAPAKPRSLSVSMLSTASPLTRSTSVTNPSFMVGRFNSEFWT